MKLKSIGIFLLLVTALLSGCAAPALDSGQPVLLHEPALIGWQRTDNLSIISSTDFKLDVLQIFVTPEYIMLICAVSGDLGMNNNIQQVNVLDANQQAQGQTRVTTIREFKQGKLIALTYYGSRQKMSKPLFSITGLAGKDNTMMSGKWDVAPLQLPQGFDDRGGSFMDGVVSTRIGAVTIFSDGNPPTPVCKGHTDIGGPDEEAFFRLMFTENGKTSCLYTYVSKGGVVRELSEKEYLLKLPRP
ncbi:MAG: hypothetical protein WA821_21450 [Anaerolineales bacterium]